VSQGRNEMWIGATGRSERETSREAEGETQQRRARESKGEGRRKVHLVKGHLWNRGTDTVLHVRLNLGRKEWDCSVRGG
jgi:hypothetical protein